MRHQFIIRFFRRQHTGRMPVALAAIALMILVARCGAQTTTAPAIEGAYEHDSLRRGGDATAVLRDGKPDTLSQSQYAAPLDFRKVALSLGIVLGLVFLCRWAARWMFPSASVGRSSQVMKVLSRSVIAPKQQLLLIQVGRRLVLVGDCGQQMNALAEISDPDEVAGLLGQLQTNSSENTKPFGPILGRAQKQFDDYTGHAPPAAVDAGRPDDSEDENHPGDAEVDQTRGELSGLTEKIRMLSRQLGKS